MGSWTYTAMAPELTARWGLEPVPFPVRTSRRARIFGGEQVDLMALLRELDHYLTASPDRAWRYRDNASRLAHVVARIALEQGDIGRMADAAEIGVHHRPTSVQHHLHLALALHHLGDVAASLPHYEFVAEHPRVDIDVLPRFLHAQALEEAGRPLEAVLVVWPPPIGAELDERWWTYACRLAEQAGIDPPSRPDPDRERHAIHDALHGVSGATHAVQEQVAARFGTLRALRVSMLAQVAEVEGVDEALAARIVEAVRAPVLRGA